MTVMDATRIKALAREGLVEGLNLATHRVAAVTVPRTPLEYGDLRDAVAEGVVPATEAELESRIVVDLPYAVPVHEDLTAYHDDGEAKFLERAVTESRDDVGDIIATSVRRRLG